MITRELVEMVTRQILENSFLHTDSLSNKDEVEVDFLIMGPGCDTEAQSQAKANYLISLAGARKDCMATVGPHRANVVNITNTETQTTNLINYFSPLQSSSFAVFDSGYKYTFDRFNNKFRYIPCNPDVAGMMARTSLLLIHGSHQQVSREVLLITLSNLLTTHPRLKEIVSILRESTLSSHPPGAGTFLFGDKTALAYASAFDRINVRRLFLTIEQSLERAAQAQLFELNDDLTRANFKKHC